MDCYASKAKLIGYTVFFILLTALFGFLAIFYDKGGAFNSVIRLAGAALAIFSVAMVIITVQRALDSRPTLAISASGILLPQLWTGDTVISWNDIKEIFVYEVGGVVLIGFNLKDINKYAPMPSLWWRINRVVKMKDEADISIGFGGLDCTLEEVVEYLAAHHGDKIDMEGEEL